MSEDGEIVPGKRMNMTFADDHRVTVGAKGARSLQTVLKTFEIPILLALG